MATPPSGAAKLPVLPGTCASRFRNHEGGSDERPTGLDCYTKSGGNAPAGAHISDKPRVGPEKTVGYVRADAAAAYVAAAAAAKPSASDNHMPSSSVGEDDNRFSWASTPH